MTGKLRTYKQIKHTFKIYLDLPFHLRTAISRLRISNHSLKIETRRYNLPPLPVKERICFSCPTEVENELYFLFNCPVYQALNEFRSLLNYIYY